MRDDEVNIAGGYDGEFGVIKIFADGERARLSVPQLGLFGAELGVEQIEAAKKTEGTGTAKKVRGVTATIH
ncbi:MAG: hypothetical protein R2867_16525 [Caldilineaceae bacterium]